MSYVLLIEPNKVLAQTYQRLLVHAGFEVGHAAGAQAAVQSADVRTPDVVVLELQLPQHNGIEFLHEFRSYNEWLHIPIVLHTAVQPAQLAAVGESLRRDMGVTAILHKPHATLQDLLQTVREQLAA